MALAGKREIDITVLLAFRAWKRNRPKCSWYCACCFVSPPQAPACMCLPPLSLRLVSGFDGSLYSLRLTSAHQLLRWPLSWNPSSLPRCADSRVSGSAPSIGRLLIGVVIVSEHLKAGSAREVSSSVARQRILWASEQLFIPQMVVEMDGAFEDEAEQTISIQEYLKDVEEQELVSLCCRVQVSFLFTMKNDLRIVSHRDARITILLNLPECRNNGFWFGRKGDLLSVTERF